MQHILSGCGNLAGSCFWRVPAAWHSACGSSRPRASQKPTPATRLRRVVRQSSSRSLPRPAPRIFPRPIGSGSTANRKSSSCKLPPKSWILSLHASITVHLVQASQVCDCTCKIHRGITDFKNSSNGMILSQSFSSRRSFTSSPLWTPEVYGATS